jgi:hypothetical protein
MPRGALFLLSLASVASRLLAWPGFSSSAGRAEAGAEATAAASDVTSGTFFNSVDSSTVSGTK